MCSTSPCSTLPYLRLGNTYISAVSWDFSAANAIQSISPTGTFVLYTSDHLCTLGNGANATPWVCGGLNWQASHSYNTTDVITPQTGNTPNCTYHEAGAGTSSGTEPTWLSGGDCITSNITDNTVTWVYDGAQGTGAPGSNGMRSDVFYLETGSPVPSGQPGLTLNGWAVKGMVAQ